MGAAGIGEEAGHYRKQHCAIHTPVAKLNAHGAIYPGADRPVTYQVAVHHSEPAA